MRRTSAAANMHLRTFRKAVQLAGINPFLVEVANIREHCSWVHPNKAEATAQSRNHLAGTPAQRAASVTVFTCGCCCNLRMVAPIAKNRGAVACQAASLENLCPSANFPLQSLQGFV